jgi:hypothetical protein
MADRSKQICRFLRSGWRRWGVLLTPLVAVAAWQVYSRTTTGVMPASQLTGYFSSYGFQQLQHKVESALMLFIHSWFIVCPLLVPGAFLLAWRKRREPDTLFLLGWIGIFFTGAMVVFFAGSARYLLPMAAPVALLASRLRPKWLTVGFAAQLALALGLAIVNYQHWDGYRQFAASLRGSADTHRVWVDNDWGLRHYLEADHGIAARKSQQVRPGDIVVTTELGSSVPFTAPLSPIAKAVIQPAIPLRLIGLESHSGYSTVAKGYWPFGLSAGVIDRLSAAQVMERHPTLEYLTWEAPGAAGQIVSGIDPHDHWMFQSATVILKNPPSPAKLRVAFYISDKAPARHITLSVDGREVAAHSYPGPGSYTLESAQAVARSGESTAVQIQVDRTFSAPRDKRRLGVVLIGIGFVR